MKDYIGFTGIDKNDLNLEVGTEKISSLNIDLMCSAGAFSPASNTSSSEYSILKYIHKILKVLGKYGIINKFK